VAGSLQKLNVFGYPADWTLEPPEPNPCDPNNTVLGSANADAVLTLTTDAGQGSGASEGSGPAGPVQARPVIVPQLFYSYSAPPAAGTLVILKDGNNVIFQEYCRTIGAAQIDFHPPLRATPGNSVTLTAKAGGAGITAVVSLPNAYVLAE